MTNSDKQLIEKVLKKRVDKNREMVKKVIEHIRGPQSIFNQNEITRESGIIDLITKVLIYHFQNDPANLLLKYSQNNRYLLRSKTNNVPKITSGPKRQFEVLMQQNYSRFRQEVRMSKAAFNSLCELLRNHPEYQYKGLGRRQFDVEIQVMIALNFLGTSGTGASHTAVARRYSIGGMV